MAQKARAKAKASNDFIGICYTCGHRVKAEFLGEEIHGYRVCEACDQVTMEFFLKGADPPTGKETGGVA